MSTKRVFYIMLGLIAAISLVGIGAVVSGNSMLKKQSDKLLNLKLENSTLEEQQRSLVQANKDIQKYSELEKIAKSIVPKDKDQAATVREIVTIAGQSGITISSITFPSSNLGMAPTRATTSGGTSQTTQQTTDITQVKPVDGLPGVYELTITVQSDSNNPVPYTRFINFLQKLEQNRRTAQVTNINVQPAAKNRNAVSFTLDVNVYIKP